MYAEHLSAIKSLIIFTCRHFCWYPWKLILSCSFSLKRAMQTCKDPRRCVLRICLQIEVTLHLPLEIDFCLVPSHWNEQCKLVKLRVNVCWEFVCKLKSHYIWVLVSAYIYSLSSGIISGSSRDPFGNDHCLILFTESCLLWLSFSSPCSLQISVDRCQLRYKTITFKTILSRVVSTRTGQVLLNPTWSECYVERLSRHWKKVLEHHHSLI
jgi:hypothetical protein